MKTAFDLKKQLKQHDKGLLQQLFRAGEGLENVPWSKLKKTDVDPIITGIRSLPMHQRRQIQWLLQSIAKLADNRGLKVIHEELSQRYPEMVSTWGALKNRADKVLWVYLNARDAFEEAAVFARADALSVTRYFNRWGPVSCDGFEASDERIGDLKAELRTHYSQNELRGEHCEVHHYTRLNGDEYFFAYLPDWPDNFMVFNDNGELATLDIPTAFTNLFVYEPSTGAVELIATGGNTAQQKLRKIFYRAMCQQEVADADPDKPEFLLDHLLKPGFTFQTELADRIETVTAPQVLLVPIVDAGGLEGLQCRFRKAMSWFHSLELIDSLLQSRDLSRDQVAVDHIQIRFQFTGDEAKRGKTFTLRMSPRSSNLKAEDDEELQVIVENCLRRWGVING
jgi:hypothetical protein